MKFMLSSIHLVLLAITATSGQQLRRKLQGGGGDGGGGRRRTGGRGGGGGGDGPDGGGNSSGGNCPIRNPNSEDDLGVRFNKIPDDVREQPAPELRRLDYPINPSTFEWMRETGLHSVREETMYCPECYTSLCELIQASGGHPNHPSSRFSDPFWTEDMLAVVEWQVLRQANGSHAIDMYMPTPETWKKTWTTVDDAAVAVHDEYPGSHHEELIKYVLRNGAEVDASIIPLPCRVEFIRGVVLLSDLNTWAFGVVGPVNFGAKYFVGRARPEEVAFKIYNDVIFAPAEIERPIKEMQLTDATSFTAYPEGSPPHPSFPAMHSASSVSSLWLAVVMDFEENEEMWCQAMLTDYAVATARTVAGVHYPSDNIAGLKMGQRILADKLPRHLSKKYGSDENAVRSKINRILARHDWDSFESSECYFSGLNEAAFANQ